MMEDITIGVTIFVALIVLAIIGRKAGLTQTDIWA